MDEWRFITGSSIYQVNRNGKIRRIERIIMRRGGRSQHLSEMEIKPFVTNCGYEIINLQGDIKKKKLVHRVVMETFSPLTNMEHLQVNHKDSNKRNNDISNLEWCDALHNMAHAMAAGTFNPQNRFGEKHPLCKLTSVQVDLIRQSILEKGKTQRSLAKEYGVSEATISEIKTGRKRRKG